MFVIINPTGRILGSAKSMQAARKQAQRIARRVGSVIVRDQSGVPVWASK